MQASQCLFAAPLPRMEDILPDAAAAPMDVEPPQPQPQPQPAVNRGWLEERIAMQAAIDSSLLDTRVGRPAPEFPAAPPWDPNAMVEFIGERRR